METFVERDRFAGTSYHAANWIHVGQTQGRGKLDRHKLYGKPVSRVGPGVAAGAPPSHRTCRSPAYGAPMPFHRCAVAGVP